MTAYKNIHLNNTTGVFIMKKIIYKQERMILNATYENMLDIAEVDYIQQVATINFDYLGETIPAGMTYMLVDGEQVPLYEEYLEWIVTEVMEITITDNDTEIHEWQLEWELIEYEPPYTPSYNASQMQYI